MTPRYTKKKYIIKTLLSESILALNYILYLVKEQVLIPYYVEKWTILLDLNFQAFSQSEIVNDFLLKLF